MKSIPVDKDMLLPTQKEQQLGINFQLVMQPWTTRLTSLGSTFFIYKVGKKLKCNLHSLGVLSNQTEF